jgi:hypothetical protein
MHNVDHDADANWQGPAGDAASTSACPREWGICRPAYLRRAGPLPSRPGPALPGVQIVSAAIRPGSPVTRRRIIARRPQSQRAFLCALHPHDGCRVKRD